MVTVQLRPSLGDAAAATSASGTSSSTDSLFDPHGFTLPDASSPELILVRPSPAELARTWRHTYPKWGAALPSEQDYLDREAYLTMAPLGRDGGLTRWILTIRGLPADQRPILSSCESLRKRALVALPAANGTKQDEEVTLVEGITHAIGSVFTEPAYRGRGYASRMMREVGERLKTWQAERAPLLSNTPRRTLFSVLYSDIGKHFYARHGWAAFPSTHVAFKPASITTGPASFAHEDPLSPLRCGSRSSNRHVNNNNSKTNTNDPSRVSPPPSPPSPSPAAARTARRSSATATPIGYHELAELCAADERLLRSELIRRVRSKKAGSGIAAAAAVAAAAAILPDLDAMLWHLMREDFMTKRIFGRTPTVRGAVAGVPGRRVWAVWMRGYYGCVQEEDGKAAGGENVLHILRVVVDDDDDDDGGRGNDDDADENEGGRGVPTGDKDDDLAEGFRSILRLAQREAAAWRTHEVQVWNPPARVARLLARCGIPHEVVEREESSIPSLMWYGEGETREVEWVANEKYAWF
ncbi:hypothetical protein VTJ83DRAFT_4499 [Remersonia thermophila]|uniref:N-acetyltransferase domain-containing protein n=1 Tax=Remersonia thermophila TaxID=72144 RepID=A0ABR4DAB5_9PEZI